MTALDKIRSTQAAAKAIIATFVATAESTPDVTEARKSALLAELEGLKSAEKIDKLIAHIIQLEAPKAENKVKVEDVARALMESPDCATLTWQDVADLIQSSGLGEKTSAASIASYASKRKGEWNIVAREKLRFNAASLLEAANM